MPLFDMDPEMANNLVNFGFGAMAAGGQPGATMAGALGQGGLAMNNAALQRAQTQNTAAEAQSRQLQNQLVPYQLQLMKYRMQALQQDMGDDNSSPPSGGAGMPYSSTPGAAKPIEQPITAKPTNEPTIAPAVFRTAQKTGLPPALLHGVYMTESSGNPDAPNGDGGAAMGGMQLHAGAAKDAGVKNRNDPQQNLTGGATYLKQMTDKYGSPQMGILAYNWGPGNVDNWLASGGDPAQIPQPQQDYLKKVNGHMQSAIPQSAAKRNIGQGVESQPASAPAESSPQPANQLPQTSSDIQTLQGRIAQMSKKLRIAEGIGMPTKDLEINLKSAQEQLAEAMKKRQEVEASGPKKEGEDSGTNKAAAEKTLKVITSNLPIAMKRFQELRAVAPDTSYGLGAEGKDNEPGFKETLAYQFSPNNKYFSKTANANTIFQQKTAQGVLPELGPSLAQAGIKGNKFLETLANEASGLSLSADPASKLSGIQGLEDQYIRNLKSTADQVRAYGGNAPTEKEIDDMVAQMKGASSNDSSNESRDLTKYKNPKMIGKAYQSGEITKDQATMLLKQNHGLK